jgi:hypothetical protein
MTQLRWLVAGLSLRSPEFVPESVHVVSVVDKVALGKVYLQVIQFSPVNIIPPWLSILIYNLGDEQLAHCKPSSGRQSHPTDMINSSRNNYYYYNIAISHHL